MRTAVLGAGGFIGSWMVKRLKSEGHHVVACDLKYPEFSRSHADEFLILDLRNPANVRIVLDQQFDEVYQFAADMGGAGFVFTGEHDAEILHNNALINLNVARQCVLSGVKKVFFASSACIYPQENQQDPLNPKCNEESAYPAHPDSDYGWEKLFSERIYLAYHRNNGLNVRIARYHNIFGPEGTWDGGREKAPAAVCRKVAKAEPGGRVDIWGDGEQTRSFLYIDDCINLTSRLMDSDFHLPVNIGSEEMVTINRMVELVCDIAGKSVLVNHIPGPLGVRGRNSDNTLLFEKVGWYTVQPLHEGLKKTYKWISEQIQK